MSYFIILGIAFGLAAMLKPIYMHLIPWNENKFIAKAYSKKRPKWIVPVAIVGLLLVVFTWYKDLTTDVAYSMVIHHAAADLEINLNIIKLAGWWSKNTL